MNLATKTSLLPPDLYLATVLQEHEYKMINEIEHLILWFAVDTGSYAHRKVAWKVPCTDRGDRMLADFSAIVRHRVRGSILPSVRTPAFGYQFAVIRAGIHVDIFQRGEVIHNQIVAFRRTRGEPEENVLLRTQQDHFFRNRNPRKLPIK